MKKLRKTNSPHAGLSVRGQLLLVFVCLVFAWLGFWAYTVLADVSVTNTAMMRIDPVCWELDPGQSFSVTVVIDNVTNLGAFQFDLSYNASIVHVTGVTLGPFLGSTGRPVSEVGPDINNSTGLTSYGAWSGPSSLDGPSGSGTLATITFDTVGLGTTPLSLQNVEITDPVGIVLAVNFEGGEVADECPESDFSVYLPIVLNNY
jgi:hypothetical protein